jgi:hypothetical protein
MMGEGAISWMSKKQASTATSSTEAEYMALSNATKEAIWLKRLLAEMGFRDNSAVPIFEDNEGAIALTKNPEFHARTKHIAPHYHFTREQVEEGTIAIHYCHTTEMVADFLTKRTDPKDHAWGTKECGVGPKRP